MQQLVNFITKYKYFLFFLLLEIIALSLTIQNHSYHKSKFVNSANFVSGGIYNRINKFREFTKLRTYNDQLLEENTRLKNIIAQQRIDTTDQVFGVTDTTKFNQRYLFTRAKIIDNQYHKRYNYLTIDKGSKNGILFDQAVVNSKGIIGITQSVSKNFATVQSILNENSRINVSLSNSLHFGSLEWDGKDYNVLQLVDLPIQANIKIGDSIITGGRSIIFPAGIPVGTIEDFGVENNSYSFINVRLFNDMSAIGPVNVIVSLFKEEINTLEEARNEY
ncbi:MAG: rod shape-determining protein MreC [Flavobacteriaceae bacterium]|nr:rod shape-determining protein MreC [Flavobacteriaceae bacterium]